MIHKKEEQTLIIFKPDSVQRGIVGEILARFEKVGLKIVGMKMLRPTQEHYFHHYETIGTMVTRHGQKIFDATLAMMNEGPVISCVLEGVEAASVVRKMVGATEPKSALPGTIRGDYAHVSYGHADGQGLALSNIIHASGNAEEAKLEIAHWFSPDELFEYESVHEKFTQRKTSHLNRRNNSVIRSFLENLVLTNKNFLHVYPKKTLDRESYDLSTCIVSVGTYTECTAICEIIT